MSHHDRSWLSKSRGPLEAIPEQPWKVGQPKYSGKATPAPEDKTRSKQQAYNIPPRGAPKTQQQQQKGNGKSHQSNFNINQPAVQVQPQDRPDMLMKHEFRRGMIMNAPLFEEDRYQSRGPSEYRSIAAQGIVFGKPRYMIVVGLHYDHYVAVAIYTHEGKGLANKSSHKDEFISVRDGRIPRSKFTRLSDQKELITDGVGSYMSPLSTVWYTRPISRSYDLRIKCEGKLTEESVDHLCSCIRKANDKMLGL